MGVAGLAAELAPIPLDADVLLRPANLVKGIGFDRALGYGLKYSAGFSFTHLGLIGQLAKSASNPLFKRDA